jgi:hypothetical protein
LHNEIIILQTKEKHREEQEKEKNKEIEEEQELTDAVNLTDEKTATKRNSITDITENVVLQMTNDPNLNKVIVNFIYSEKSQLP